MALISAADIPLGQRLKAMVSKQLLPPLLRESCVIVYAGLSRNAGKLLPEILATSTLPEVSRRARRASDALAVARSTTLSRYGRSAWWYCRLAATSILEASRRTNLNGPLPIGELLASHTCPVAFPSVADSPMARTEQGS